MTPRRVLIACIGNIFLGDDGFGTEVARRLAGHPLPPEAIVKDFGIRALDLTYALLEPYELVILVDACSRGSEPGTVYLIEPDPVDSTGADGGAPRLDAHSMNPMQVLRAAHSMGAPANRILIVGCEPAETGTDEEGKLGLSDPVERAIDGAIALIRSLVTSTLDGKPTEIALQSH
jgi:hydrogenase maturation protease